ncbi:MAG: hypothetical protein Salg2KO_19020 [Salibacteraceae bacterium]
MEAILDILSKFGPGALVPIGAFAFVGILAQWSLYDKCGLPGIDCIIPVKNVITFLKIMGRPAKHSLMVMIPPPLIIASLIVFDNPALQYGVAAVFFIPWAYFMTKVYIELCQCFGHYRLLDYVLCVAFNGFYVLHLGLSYNEKYKGPVYGKSKQDTSAMASQQVAA